MVFAIVLLVLLALSVLWNVGSFFAHSLTPGKIRSSRAVGPRLEEVVTEDNDSANKIAVVEIGGIISSSAIETGGYDMVDVIKAQLKRAQEDERVRAVILKVNSPGGEVLASDEINHLIGTFQTNSKKPVIASMGNLAASGGYYVSAPCRWIVANELTITGSIGVILHSWNYRGLMNKVGLQPQVYKSGKHKDMLSGERNPEEVPEEERTMLQGLIDETYTKFKKVVEDGRKRANDKNKNSKDKGKTLDEHWTDYADGRVLTGTKAFELGFVDELGNFDKAIERATTIAGIGKANLIEYQPRHDLSDLLRLFGQSNQAEGRVLKVDLGVDVPKLQAGQLYFLSPTFAH